MSPCRFSEDVPLDLVLEDKEEFYQEMRWEKTFPKRRWNRVFSGMLSGEVITAAYL